MRPRTAFKFVLLLCTGSMLPFSGTAHAANCSVSVAQAVNFGNYNPLSATADTANGRISVDCNGKGTWTIALSTGSSGSYASRTLLDGAGDVLDYNLYKDAAFTMIWGDGTGGTVTVSKNFKNNTKNARIHGQIPAGQNVAAGNYTDSIIVTVTF